MCSLALASVLTAAAAMRLTVWTLASHSHPLVSCNHGPGQPVKQREDRREQMKVGKNELISEVSTEIWALLFPFCLSIFLPCVVCVLISLSSG